MSSASPRLAPQRATRSPSRLRRLLARPWVRLAVHLLVLAGLLVMLGGTLLAEPYFTRGVAVGDELPPIPHTDVNPLGINTHLQDEGDPAKVERSLDMIAAAGFTFVRQPFPWNDIELAPDNYWDTRNNISAWAKYDRLVDLAVARKLEVVARLDKPPAWSRAGQPNVDRIPDGPPNNDADYADFVASVVERYRGRIRYIQIWNEPNLAGEWGGQPIDPAAFTRLLKAAYLAAKQADPAIVVLMPGLAPTDQTGPQNLSDLLFLQGMYDAGARDYFDIASVMVYGYGYSPYDRRVEFARNNFSRPIQTREIMVRNGDAAKPVWATEYGYTTRSGDPANQWQVVSESLQARYLVETYHLVRRELPWLTALFLWNISTDLPEHHEMQGYSVLRSNGRPKPAFEALRQLYRRPPPLFGWNPTGDRTPSVWSWTEEPPPPAR